MASDDPPDEPSKADFDRIWDMAKANYQPPRHRRHGARISKAGYEIIPRDLAALITYMEAWFELPKKVRTGRPGQSPPAFLQISRLNELARRLQKKVNQFLALKSRAAQFYLGQFGHIATMLNGEGADRWPTGLTRDHLAELRFHQRSLANAMAGIYVAQPKPRREHPQSRRASGQTETPTGDELIKLTADLRDRQREVQASLTTLMAAVEKWLRRDDGWRDSGLGQRHAGYLALTVQELLRKIPGVLRAYHDLGLMPIWAFDELSQQLQRIPAGRRPDGLTEDHLDDLKKLADIIGNELVEQVPIPVSDPAPSGPTRSVAKQMSREHRRAKYRPAFLAFMEEHEEASYKDLNDQLWSEDPKSHDAIESLVRHTNTHLKKINHHFILGYANKVVYRKPPPA